MEEATGGRNQGIVIIPRHQRNPKTQRILYNMRIFTRNRIAFVGMLIVVGYAVIAILDWIYPQYLGVKSDSTLGSFVSTYGGLRAFAYQTAPGFSNGWQYLLGGTEYNVPVLPLMMAAIKTDLFFATVVVLGAALLGTIYGALSGFMGGGVDEIMMRIADIFLSVPTLVFAILIWIILGANFTNLVLALVLVMWPFYARIARSSALFLRHMNYIEASTALGSGRLRNLLIHVIPNLTSPILVRFTMDLGNAVTILATLFFLGLYYRPTLLAPPEIGEMISIAATSGYVFTGQWWSYMFPGLFLLLFAVGANLFGDGIRDILDPRLRF